MEGTNLPHAEPSTDRRLLSRHAINDELTTSFRTTQYEARCSLSVQSAVTLDECSRERQHCTSANGGEGPSHRDSSGMASRRAGQASRRPWRLYSLNQPARSAATRLRAI